MKMTKAELENFIKKVEIIEEPHFSLWERDEYKDWIHDGKIFYNYRCPCCGKLQQTTLEPERFMTMNRYTYCGYCGHKNIV